MGRGKANREDNDERGASLSPGGEMMMAPREMATRWPIAYLPFPFIFIPFKHLTLPFSHPTHTYPYTAHHY